MTVIRRVQVPDVGSVDILDQGDRFLVTHRARLTTPLHQRHCETRDQAEAAYDDCLTEIGAHIRANLALRSLIEHPDGPEIDLTGFTDHDLVLAARAGIIEDIRHWPRGYQVTAGDRQGWATMAMLAEVG